MDRRMWMERAVQAVGLTVGGVLVVPAAINVLSPVFEPRDTERWRPIGPLDDFPVGEVTKTTVQIDGEPIARSVREKGVFVWRPSNEDIIVYSRNCTDLSCPVTWDEGSGWFYCPCHGGVFTIEGDPVAGPPDRPLYRYAVRVRDGVVEIDLKSLPPMT